MEVKRLILEDDPLLVGVDPGRLAWMRSEYTKRSTYRTGPPVVRHAGAVVRQSEQEQDLRQQVAKWLKRHAHARYPDMGASAKASRALYLRQINSALVQTFGLRATVPAARLQALLAYVHRTYPV